MLTLNHRPYIKIRPAKCRIDASNPPGRYNNYNNCDKLRVQGFIEAVGQEEGSNEPINEYACANEEIQPSLDYDYCADTAESDVDCDEDYCVGADSGQELELLPAELNDCDHNRNDCAEKPINLLNLVPTFYWDYPYICPGQRAYRQNHYLR